MSIQNCIEAESNLRAYEKSSMSVCVVNNIKTNLWYTNKSIYIADDSFVECFDGSSSTNFWYKNIGQNIELRWLKCTYCKLAKKMGHLLPVHKFTKTTIPKNQYQNLNIFWLQSNKILPLQTLYFDRKNMHLYSECMQWDRKIRWIFRCSYCFCVKIQKKNEKKEITYRK